jgi:hypothetical protein
MQAVSHIPQDHEIHEAALQFLMTADLNSLTLKTLKAALEARFGCQLDPKKELIKNTLLKFIENYVYKSPDGGQPELNVDPNTKKRTRKYSTFAIAICSGSDLHFVP